MATAIAGMELKLKVIGGKNNGVEIAVAGPQFLVGRADECQLRPKSDFVSRRHALITVEDGRSTIADQGSRTGTYVNGKLLAPQTPAELKQDDVVKIGPLEFSVVIKHGLNRQKQSKVTSLEEAAARTAQQKKVDDDDVSQWLQPTEQELSLNETIEGPASGLISAAELLGQTVTDEPTPEDDKKKAVGDGRPDQAASDMLKNYLRRR
jgi:pSer/pThr/pTyr-binding forkhead associated (FHA) protein